MKETKNDVDDVRYELGKIVIDIYYSYQQIRIAQKSRIRDIIRRKIEGIPLDKPEEKKEEKKHDKKYEDKNLPKFLGELVLDGKITDFEKGYIEKLFKLSDETAKTEEKYKFLMDQFLKKEKIWYMWLEKIRGISSVLGSNLIKNFGYCELIIKDKKTGEIIGYESGNPDEFKEAMKKYKENPDKYTHSGYEYVSSLWRHCGFDPDGAKGLAGAEVGEDGKKHIHYSPKLKTLIWKIGDSFVKQRTPVYRKIYDNEKVRQLELMRNEADNAPKSLLHADLRARRKMVKIFLQHYYLISRKIKGLPVTDPYPHDRMGHKHLIKPPFDPFDNSAWKKPKPKAEEKKAEKKSMPKAKSKKEE